MPGRVGDAKSVTVVAPAGGTVAGQFYRIGGWNGWAFATVAAGAEVALDIDPSGAFDVIVGAGVAAALGAVLYMPPAGGTNTDLTATAAGNVLALKVRKAKDANNVIEASPLNVS